MGVAHWDDVASVRRELGPTRSTGSDLGRAAGSDRVGVRRYRLDPGERPTPPHVHGAEEEIVFVLGGGGLSWQNAQTYEIGPGDCIVHRAAEEAHTVIAGADGLDVLAFGDRSQESELWHRDVAAGDLEVPAPTARPSTIVNVADVPDGAFGRPEGEVFASWRDLGAAAGSQRTGIKHVGVPQGKLGAPPHCHSAEEEVFVVLDGGGWLELTPAPAQSPAHARRVAAETESEQHAIRAGSVIARPAGTRVAHTLRAGPTGLVYLAYGTRDPNDSVYYPRSRKVFWRGLGVIGRVEHVDYWDGEA